MHIFLQVNKYAFIIFFIWSLESITGCHAGLLQNCQCICMLVPRIGRQILTWQGRIRHHGTLFRTTSSCRYLDFPIHTTPWMNDVAGRSPTWLRYFQTVTADAGEVARLLSLGGGGVHIVTCSKRWTSSFKSHLQLKKKKKKKTGVHMWLYAAETRLKGLTNFYIAA